MLHVTSSFPFIVDERGKVTHVAHTRYLYSFSSESTDFRHPGSFVLNLIESNEPTEIQSRKSSYRKTYLTSYQNRERNWKRNPINRIVSHYLDLFSTVDMSTQGRILCFVFPCFRVSRSDVEEFPSMRCGMCNSFLCSFFNGWIEIYRVVYMWNSCNLFREMWIFSWSFVTLGFIMSVWWGVYGVVFFFFFGCVLLAFFLLLFGSGFY